MRPRGALSIAVIALALAQGGCGDDGGADRAGALANAAAAEVDAVLVQARELLTELAADPALRHPDPESDHADDEQELERARARSRRRCSAAVAKAARERGGYEAVGRAAVEGAGAVDCLSAPLRTPWNVGDRAFFLRAYNTGEFAVGDYQFDGHEIGQSLGTGLPTETAVIFALVDLEVVWERLAQLPLPEGADLVVTDGNGTVIARPTTAYSVGRSQAGIDPLTDAMLDPDADGGTYEYERRERTYAFAAPESASGSIRVAAGVLP